MTSEVNGKPGDLPELERYEALSAATPTERVAILLRLISEHPEGRLELPAIEGQHAILDEVDLSVETLGRLEGSADARWRDPDSGGINLRGADLRGASLRNANLSLACLSNADLSGAILGLANLQGANLDGANLQNADLAGASLIGAALGEADLSDAMLEETDLRDSTLRFAKLGNAILEDANLQRADLWGTDFTGAILSNANFQHARLEEANLSQTDLSGAKLQSAILRRSKLEGAKLNGADLAEAVFLDTDLRGASLRDAKLQGADLSQCKLDHIHLSGARLEATRLEKEQLGGAIGEELAKEFDQARKGYLALERAFQDLGDHDASNWAYRRRRRIQKQLSLKRAQTAQREKNWGSMISFYALYASDQAVEWICDYGESIPRVMASIFWLYLLFNILYGITGSVVREQETPNGVVLVTTRNVVDLAIFSLLALTTGSIGMRLLPAHDLALILVGINVFLGVALVGLFGFVLGNRIRR